MFNDIQSAIEEANFMAAKTKQPHKVIQLPGGWMKVVMANWAHRNKPRMYCTRKNQ